MWQQLLISVRLLFVLTFLTGVIYPLTVTAVAQLCFPHQANGSLITELDRIRGSELIGQQFSKSEYFWGRISATAPVACNAAASGGSNFGPLNPDLLKMVQERLSACTASSSGHPPQVPVDLVTSSGSGLDPHISPAAAEYQLARVAKSRNLDESKVLELVKRHTQSRQLGLLGEPRVNVLQLNLELDRLTRE